MEKKKNMKTINESKKKRYNKIRKVKIIKITRNVFNKIYISIIYNKYIFK